MNNPLLPGCPLPLPAGGVGNGLSVLGAELPLGAAGASTCGVGNGLPVLGAELLLGAAGAFTCGVGNGLPFLGATFVVAAGSNGFTVSLCNLLSSLSSLSLGSGSGFAAVELLPAVNDTGDGAAGPVLLSFRDCADVDFCSDTNVAAPGAGRRGGGAFEFCGGSADVDALRGGGGGAGARVSMDRGAGLCDPCAVDGDNESSVFVVAVSLRFTIALDCAGSNGNDPSPSVLKGTVGCDNGPATFFDGGSGAVVIRRLFIAGALLGVISCSLTGSSAGLPFS